MDGEVKENEKKAKRRYENGTIGIDCANNNCSGQTKDERTIRIGIEKTCSMALVGLSSSPISRSISNTLSRTTAKPRIERETWKLKIQYHPATAMAMISSLHSTFLLNEMQQATHLSWMCASMLLHVVCALVSVMNIVGRRFFFYFRVEFFGSENPKWNIKPSNIDTEWRRTSSNKNVFKAKPENTHVCNPMNCEIIIDAKLNICRCSASNFGICTDCAWAHWIHTHDLLSFCQFHSFFGVFLFGYTEYALRIDESFDSSCSYRHSQDIYLLSCFTSVLSSSSASSISFCTVCC